MDAKEAVDALEKSNNQNPWETKNQSVSSSLRDRVGTLCHNQWSMWMKYLFDRCEVADNGDIMIPMGLVERWQRQMQTPFFELSLTEKESDRIEADRFIKFFRENQKYLD